MSRRLSAFILLALLHAVALRTAHAQTFYFNDGRKASLPEARIKGSKIIVPLKLDGATAADGVAELTFAISSIQRLDWPAPVALAQAEADLKAGKPADALQKVNAVLPAQEIFREIPGSWWNQGAIIKAVALARLGQDADAEAVLDLLRRAKAGPEIISRGEIALIDQLAVTGKIAAAESRLDKLQASATDDATLAGIALTRGRLLENANRPEDALLSYLRVPVYYSAEDAQMPAALLGASRLLTKLGDTTRAAATAGLLATRYPNSPEAAQAKP